MHGVSVTTSIDRDVLHPRQQVQQRRMQQLEEGAGEQVAQLGRAEGGRITALGGELASQPNNNTGKASHPVDLLAHV